MSGRRGAKHHAEKIRQGFWRALEQMDLRDDEGRPVGVIEQVAEIWKRVIADDPAMALQTLAKFTPKELMIEGGQPAEPFVLGAAPTQSSLEQWIAIHSPRTHEGDPPDP